MEILAVLSTPTILSLPPISVLGSSEHFDADPRVSQAHFFDWLFASLSFSITLSLVAKSMKFGSEACDCLCHISGFLILTIFVD